MTADYALGERGEYKGVSAGKAVSSELICNSASEIWGMSGTERLNTALLRDRAQTIAYGAAMLCACLKASGVKTAAAAAGDNLEGYLRMILSGAE